MKTPLALVVIGHVDHGKSTLVGRLLLEKGVVTPEQIARHEKEGAEIGKASFKFAWVLDQDPESRRRGLTIDLGHAGFETGHRDIHVIDAPGHRDFVKNMITGTTGADAALLVVDVAEGPMPQTREHAQLARLMGLEQVVVALNKCDRVGYDRKAIAGSTTAVRDVVGPLGFHRLDVIPCSAWEGVNLVQRPARSSAMGWYTGRCLEEALDTLEVRPTAVEGPLRLPVLQVLTIGGVGTVVLGRLEAGKVGPGDEVKVVPSGVVGVVKQVELDGKTRTGASAGQTVGLALRNVARLEVDRGDVLGPVEDAPSFVDEFTARFSLFAHAGAVRPGWTPRIHAHTASVLVRLVEVLEKHDPTTGQPSGGDPQSLAEGDIALARFVPVDPLVVEPAERCPGLARFALREGGATVAAGTIVAVTRHDATAPGEPSKHPGISFKHQKSGTAARQKKREKEDASRDIWGKKGDQKGERKGKR